MTLLNRKALREPRRMNIKKIRRLMKKYNLFCPIRKPNPYRKILRDMYAGKIAANEVDREFRKHEARAILLTDITYIKRCDGKFTYLSHIHTRCFFMSLVILWKLILFYLPFSISSKSMETN